MWFQGQEPPQVTTRDELVVGQKKQIVLLLVFYLLSLCILLAFAAGKFDRLAVCQALLTATNRYQWYPFIPGAYWLVSARICTHMT